MSKSQAKRVAGKCNIVHAYVSKGGKAGATIVAGPHATPTDSKIHLTVRLYDEQGKHTKSCHVYTGKNSSFASCNCEYID